MLYSPKTQGFYLPAIHGKNIPKDAVEKTEAECAEIRKQLAKESNANDSTVLRANAYREESDGLFFKERRGEVTQGTWTAKVNEIKERFPK